MPNLAEKLVPPDPPLRAIKPFVDAALQRLPPCLMRCIPGSTFSQNQERLLQHQTVELPLARIVALGREHAWVSDAHLAVGRTLIDT